VLSSLAYGPALLRTCREIHGEAYKYLFRRPIILHSQQYFYTWIDDVAQPHLSDVTQILLNIEDVDLHPLLQPDVSTTSTHIPVRLLTWDIYEEDLERLRQAFTKLPDVKAITIRALPDRQSFFYRQYLTKVLEMLGSVYPSLRRLTLEGYMHHQSLAFLSDIVNLQAFTFGGFSTSSAKETAHILANLVQLKRLSLVLQHMVPTSTRVGQSPIGDKRQSITREVVGSVKQLTAFSVTEQIYPAPPTTFFTSEVLSALHTHEALVSLSISLCYTPNTETLQSLRDFLEHSLIEELELDWPGLQRETMDMYALIPEGIKVVCLRADSATDVADMLCSLESARRDGDFPRLELVVFKYATKDCDNFSAAVCDKKGSGIEVVTCKPLKVSIGLF
jgi:hypothetical protein